jgi:hypothetical protein
MHVQGIVQDLLDTNYPTSHAKRRRCDSVIADAGSRGSLNLMGINRALSSLRIGNWSAPYKTSHFRVTSSIKIVVPAKAAIQN